MPQDSSVPPSIWFSQNIWNEHPIISAVLWLLGGDPNSTFEDSNSTPAKLSWKDEHGGDIAEIINDSNSIGKQARVDTLTKHDNTADFLQDEREKKPNDLTSIHDSNATYNADQYQVHSDVGDSESDQWGWYVSITPPKQEVYAKEKTDTRK